MLCIKIPFCSVSTLNDHALAFSYKDYLNFYYWAVLLTLYKNELGRMSNALISCRHSLQAYSLNSIAVPLLGMERTTTTNCIFIKRNYS